MTVNTEIDTFNNQTEKQLENEQRNILNYKVILQTEK